MAGVLGARGAGWKSAAGNRGASGTLFLHNQGERIMGKGILLWLIGVPIPVILLLWFFFH
ncbi:hypothetical protein [Novosphingobium resinovorum]|uniref:hypothetical protein n=1 Tax=Novosphingobium resinovorum TaxID=158500 RepID=UPI002ED21DE2|nr:hypothetical protein [Novosphingobium resinovorum]